MTGTAPIGQFTFSCLTGTAPIGQFTFSCLHPYGITYEKTQDAKLLPEHILISVASLIAPTSRK